MIEYFELGELPDTLTSAQLYPATVALIKACEQHPHIAIRELRIGEQGDDRSEYIVIDAGDGEVNAGNPGKIRRKERLAIEINPERRVPIVVRTLRKDFPSLSHQHAWVPGTPRTLCLYETAWSAEERSWTAERFLRRVFWWLKESSELRLHREDQPLEQLFYLSPYQLILPANHYEYANSTDRKLMIQEVHKGPPITWRAVPESDGSSVKAIRMLMIEVPPVEAKSVVMFPETLGALHEQLVSWGSELADRLLKTTFDAIPNGIKPPSGKGEALLILVWVPRLRNGRDERPDVMGYVVGTSLYELAGAFDILGPKDGAGLQFRFQPLDGQVGSGWQQFPLLPVEIRPSMDAKKARDLSAIDHDTAIFKGVLAGVGALGSTLADIWVRSGWGQWTFIDPDQLLPHNLVRQLGFDGQLGLSKTAVVQELASYIYPHEPAPAAIAKSVIDQDDEVLQALREAQLVVDVTTTFEVPRSLAVRDEAPRTVSLFLTPSGHSSVMLMEDASRTQRIDALEGQYYRAILNSEWGQSHLEHHYGDRWVGGGCRDISVRMSNECIHAHAGILSRQLRQAVLKDDARLCVWSSDEASGAVRAHEVELFAVRRVITAGWSVVYDHGLLLKLREIRRCALPNETGGAILGVTDFKNRTITLVDVLPAPPDSEFNPTHFIRGREGQRGALERVQELTARVVDYVGDWHSHPPGSSARASADDEKLIATLHQRMSVDGLPAVMVIVSEQEMNIVVKH